jgi:hypothetical protein
MKFNLINISVSWQEAYGGANLPQQYVAMTIDLLTDLERNMHH